MRRMLRRTKSRPRRYKDNYGTTPYDPKTGGGYTDPGGLMADPKNFAIGDRNAPASTSSTYVAPASLGTTVPTDSSGSRAVAHENEILDAEAKERAAAGKPEFGTMMGTNKSLRDEVRNWSYEMYRVKGAGIFGMTDGQILKAIFRNK